MSHMVYKKESSCGIGKNSSETDSTSTILVQGVVITHEGSTSLPTEALRNKESRLVNSYGFKGLGFEGLGFRV